MKKIKYIPLLLFTAFIFYLNLEFSSAQIINPEKSPKRQWEKQYNIIFQDCVPSSQDGRDWPLDVKQSSDGGYIACGYSKECTFECSPGSESPRNVPCIIKLDVHGNKMWHYTYINGGDVWQGQFNEVIELSDHTGYAAVGYGYTCDLTIGISKTFFVKINNDGTILNSELIGRTNNDNEESSANSISEINDGKFIVGGSYYDKVNLPTCSGYNTNPPCWEITAGTQAATKNLDMMALELDNYGAVLNIWTYDVLGQYFDDGCIVRPIWDDGVSWAGVHSFDQSKLSGFIVAGGYGKSCYDLNLNGTADEDEGDAWIGKLDNSLNLLSNPAPLTFSSTSIPLCAACTTACTFPTRTQVDNVLSLIQTSNISNNEFVVALAYNFEYPLSLSGTNTSVHCTGNCSAKDYREYEVYLLKFDEQLNIITQPTGIMHCSGDDSQTEVRETFEGGFAVSGTTADDNTLPTSYSEVPILAKTDANFALEWSNIYPLTSGANICGFGMFVTNDFGFVLCGNNDIEEDNHQFIKLGSDCQTELVDDNSAWTGDDIQYGYVVSGTETWNTDRKVHGIIDVPAYATLEITGCTIKFLSTWETTDYSLLATNTFPDAHQTPTKIIVEPGGTLLIDASSTLKGFDGCGKEWMWDGIEVWGNPALDQDFPNQGMMSMVEDASIINARIGVMADIGSYNSNGSKNPSETEGGGILQIDHSNFNNNRRSIHFAPYHKTAYNASFVTYSHFNCTGPMVDPNYADALGRRLGLNAFITNYRCDLLPIDHNTFNGDPNLDANADFDIRGYGVVVADADAQISTNEFYNLNHGVDASYFSNVLATTNISDNRIDNTNTGIFAAHGDNLAISGNTISNIPTYNPAAFSGIGILLLGTGSFRVDNNNIWTTNNYTFGIIANSSDRTGGEIGRNNSFYGFQSGVGTQTENDNDYLLIDCNSYANYSNGAAWLVEPAGMGGTLPNQWLNCALGNQAGNTFDFSGSFDIYSSLTFDYNAHGYTGTVPNGVGSLTIYVCNPLATADDALSCETNHHPWEPGYTLDELRAFWSNEDNEISKQLIFNEMMRQTIASDESESNEAGIDLLNEYLDAGFNPDYLLKQLIQAYYFNGNIDQANQNLEALNNINSDPDFVNLYSHLINLVANNISIGDADDETKEVISAIADGTGQTSILAKVLLNRFFDKEFDYSPEPFDFNNLRKSNSEKIKLDNILKIVPNPANSRATIVPVGFEFTDGSQIYIQDILGNCINAKIVINILNNLTIDISSLNNGLYFIQIKDKDNKISAASKFVVNK